MELLTYDEMINSLKKKKRVKNLLIGNGFSIAYNPSIFSYNALGSYIDKTDDEDLKKLFKIIKTSNFEQIMRELDLFVQIVKEFESKSQMINKINNISGALKKVLIEAVESSHPENVFSISQDQLESCSTFLNTFTSENGKIFSTNYDLLLYWVLMRSKDSNCNDGFGRDKEEGQEFVPCEEAAYSELRWGKNKDSQNIYYLHGALHLFDMCNEIVKQEYDGKCLIEKITELMDKGTYPIFVTAGNGDEKLSHIKHSYYLADCYDSLTKITGSLITYGFNFGDYDEHIIKAINKAATRDKTNQLRSIYIGVYSENDRKHIETIESQFMCKVHIFDSKTAKIWNTSRK